MIETVDISDRIISSSITDRGLNDKRPQNEDSVLDIRELGIFAVADGVGGAQAGEIASQMAVEILAEAFSNRQPGVEAETVMRNAIERANEAIFQMSNDLPQLARMATTLVALHIEGDVATIGHVGDSRAYRLDNQFRLFRETDDHSVVAEEVRAGRMTDAEAAVHPSRNIISRALGADASVEPDVKLLMVEAGNKFLLCSDGITRHIDDEEIRQFLFEMSDPGAICERLKQVCYERGAEDNLSAVVVSIPGEVGSAADEIHFGFDDDEDTIATARARDPNAAGDATVEIPRETVSDEEEFDANHAQDHPADIALERSVAEAETVQDPASARVTPTEPFRTEATVTLQERPRRTGGLVLAALMLVVGMALGAAAYHFWQQANPPQPQLVPVLTEKSTNPPLTAFEEQRRIVDRDPAAFISSNVAEPQDAADHYLRGRAYLLTGKIWEAKRELQAARSKLGESDTTDLRTLQSEIAVALAIANSVSAPGILEKELRSFDQPSIGTDTNLANDR
ncbi:MAG: protein phosphatase 2C domain-containing protein [Pyrinomonadaceae bacterium]